MFLGPSMTKVNVVSLAVKSPRKLQSEIQLFHQARITVCLQLDPKVLARQKAQEVRDEKRSAQMKRETAGMKKMSSFFARK